MSDKETEFATFMTRSAPALARTAWLLCGDTHQAEELVQHALMKTYLAWPKARQGEPLAYARRVLANARIDEGEPVEYPIVPPEGWRDATYFHVVTRNEAQKQGEEIDGYTPLGIERWYGDGVGFELRSYGPALRDESSYLVLEGAEPITFTWAEVAALPTEPAALHDTLLDKFESTGMAEDAALDSTARLITDAPAPPAVRAAAWDLLTSVSAVEVETDVQDSEGRSGTAATFELWDRTTTVIYDEERDVPLESEESIGKMHSLQTFLTAEFVPLPDEVADSAIEIPDFTSMTREDAEVACLEKHLACTFVDTESDTVPAGTVISSDPEADALVTWGAPVTLQLSTGS